MSTMESKQLATARRLCKAVERIADALERQEAPVLELREEPLGITWQDAVLVLRDTCRDAESCSADDCPMHKWCQKFLSDDKDAPAGWVTMEG